MVLDCVKKILSEQLGIDESSITEDTRLVEDLNLDSIDKAELVTTLEDEYDKTVDYEQAMKVKTVGDIVKEIEKVLG